LPPARAQPAGLSRPRPPGTTDLTTDALAHVPHASGHCTDMVDSGSSAGERLADALVYLHPPATYRTAHRTGHTP
ncbi:MAG: hypothetical protein WCF33_01360, partial [Pseudonocardiaceae bacterium]